MKRKRILAVMMALVMTASVWEIPVTASAWEETEAVSENTAWEEEAETEEEQLSGNLTDVQGEAPAETENRFQENSKEAAGEIQQEPAEEINEEMVEEPQAGAVLPSALMDTSQYALIYPAANKQYRWNISGGGGGKNACVHLDDNSGHNCTMELKLEEQKNGASYYSIRYSGSGYYIDSEYDDSKTGRVLHNGEKNRNQDNQLFRFVPVEDSSGNVKKNTYYILSKKGDNEGKKLYIGLDKDGSIAMERKVATSSKPMEWVVEHAVIDPAFHSVQLPEENGSTICMMYPEGYKRDVNVAGDSVINGTALQLWLHGTSSKFRCMWNETYQAYRLGCMTIAERDMDRVWDVEERSYREGAPIHIWTEIEDSLSQYWRFLELGDGVYQIQNAYTGKYAALEEKKDENGVKLVTSSTPMNWRVDVVNVSSQNAKSVHWMAELSDQALLSSINIPASHDTGTARTTAYGVPLSENESTSISKCQQLYVEEQLVAGVRAFDLRVQGGMEIVHGSELAQCRKQDYSYLTFQDVLEKTKKFLEANPTETVIFKVNHQGAGSDAQVAENIDTIIKSQTYPLYLPETTAVPALGEVRGKIVMMRGYSFGDYTPESKESYFGLDLTGWGDGYDQISGAREIYHDAGTGTRVWVQDAYTVDTDTKQKHVEETIRQAAAGEIPQGAYVWNFTSCTNPPVIINNARNMTSWFLSREARNNRSGKFVGIVPMDYIDAKMCEAIYKDSGRQPEEVQFPQSAVLTYGQPLSQAQITGGSQKGTFSFKNPDMYLPKAGKHSCTIVYTPEDPSEPVQEREITVEVKKAAQVLKKRFSSVKRQVGAPSIAQKLSGIKTKVSFISADPKIVKVDSSGGLRFVGVGETYVTIRAAENENYKGVSGTFKVTVVPKTAGVKSLVSRKKGQIQIRSNKRARGNSGYQIQYITQGSKKPGNLKIKSSTTVKRVVRNLKSGTKVRVRMRAYKNVGGKTYYGHYGIFKTVVVK